MIARRRFLSIAGGTAVAALAAAPAAVLADAGFVRWKGIALGAEARILIERRDAASHIAAILAEIDRLEDIFSLYRPQSAVSRLNRDGLLEDPPFEMLSVLALCGSIHARTGGAFDPTVQPLWHLYARCHNARRRPTQAELTAATEVVDWTRVRFSSRRVAFGCPGMALTFNGIAQGFIADRTAGLLRDAGVENLLLDLGEVRATGTRASGQPWRVGVATPGGGAAAGNAMTVQDGAVAVSEPLGTVLDHDGKTGHILNPRTGKADNLWRQVSVQAPTAALADGLSTAFCLMSREKIDQAAHGVSVRTLA